MLFAIIEYRNYQLRGYLEKLDSDEGNKDSVK